MFRNKRKPENNDRVNAIIEEWKKRNEEEPQEPVLQETLKSVVANQDNIATGGPVPQSMADPNYQKPQPGKEPSRSSNAVDMLQLGLDAIGVADPTPITDGVNGAISLGRAFITDPKRRNEHLQNAAISAVSMVPYIGDTAKLLKGGRAAKTVSRAAQHAGGDAASMAEKQASRAAQHAGGDAASMAEKQASREHFRDQARDATDALGINRDRDEERNSSEPNQPSTTGGSGGNRMPPSRPPGGPPITPPTQPTPDDPDGDKGLKQHEKWTDKLKLSTEKVIEFTGWIGKTIVKGAALVEGLSLLNTGILALNRGYENYNGKIAASYAQSDVKTMQREISEGKQLEGPLSSLNESQSELKDNISKATTPMYALGIQVVDLLTKIANVALALIGPLLRVIALIMAALGKIVEAMEFIVWAIGKFLEWIGIKTPATPADSDWRTFLHDVSDGKFDGRKPEFGTNRRVHSKQILPDQDHKDVFGP